MSESFPLQPLPYSPALLGAHRADTETSGGAEYMRSLLEGSGPFEGEVPHTLERDLQIENIRAAFQELGEEIGLDVSPRLPRSSAYHFFDTKEALHAALRSVGHEVDEGVEARATMYGIFVLNTGNDRDDAHVIGHETMHSIVEAKMRVTVPDGSPEGRTTFRLKRAGYLAYDDDGQPQAFSAVDEMFTELAIRHLMRGKRWQESFPPQDATSVQVYPGLTIIGDELIQSVAADLGVPPIQVLYGIERDMLTGASTALRTLTSFLGSTDAKEALIKAPHVGSLEEHIALAERLRLASAVHRLRHIGEGNNGEVLKWLGATQ